MFGFGGSTGTNYPAGANPWNSQPVQTPPGYTYFTPGQTPAAEEMNWLFASLSGASGSNVTVPGIGWKTLATLTGIGTGTNPVPTGGRWDAVANNRWLMCAQNFGGVYADVYAFQGSGDSTDVGVAVDNGTGVGTIYPTDCYWDGTHFFMGGVSSGGAAIIYRCSPGGAWSSVLSIAGTTYGPVNFVVSGGFIYAFITQTTAMNVYYAPVGGGASWSGPVGVPVNSGSFICAATNGTNWVMFANYSGATNYGYSTAPQTLWIGGSVTFMTHTDAPYGLVWSPADQLFVLVTAGTDSKMHTYVSSTGVSGTWTEQGTGIAYPGTGVRNLAVTGQGCLAAIVNATPDFTIYSVDAGATWHNTPNTLPAPAHTLAGLTSEKIAGSPFGFMATNFGAARFSHAAGLTPALT